MALEIDIADSLSADKITRYLDRLTHYHGYPLKIRVDNGAEFTANRFTSWAKSIEEAKTTLDLAVLIKIAL